MKINMPKSKAGELVFREGGFSREGAKALVEWLEEHEKSRLFDLEDFQEHWEEFDSVTSAMFYVNNEACGDMLNEVRTRLIEAGRRPSEGQIMDEMEDLCLRWLNDHMEAVIEFECGVLIKEQ